MSRTVNTRKETAWTPLFEVETEHLKAQGTYKSADTTKAFYGYINLIVLDYVSIKCSVIEGKNGAFISFPQNKSGDTYYSQVIPMNKDVAKEIDEIAKLCAIEFDK